MKSWLFISILPSLLHANLEVGLVTTESTPDKTRIVLQARNTFDREVTGARVMVLLVDTQGKVVGQQTPSGPNSWSGLFFTPASVNAKNIIGSVDVSESWKVFNVGGTTSMGAAASTSATWYINLWGGDDE